MEEIVKSIVYEGSQKVHFQPETKVRFTISLY